LKPSSILCIGYPEKRRPPKPRRNLKELIQVVEWSMSDIYDFK